MKTYISLFLIFVMLLSLSACSKAVPDLSREEVLALPLDIDFSYTKNVDAQWLPLEEPSELSLLTADLHRGLSGTEPTAIEVFEPINEDLSYYYDIDPVEGSSTSMMQAWHGVDHFFLLSKIPEGASTTEMEADLQAYRPCEWCPGEGPEGNTVLVRGNYILLVIAEPAVKEVIVRNFKALVQG